MRVVAVVGICVMGGTVFAQPPGLSSKGKAAEFKYYVWGQVRMPGIHLLGPEIGIMELLSAAGGPQTDANLGKIDIIHGIDHRLERINLNEMIEVGETISLSPGDVVIVRRSFWPRFRETLTLVSSLAVFLNLAYTVSRYYK